MANRKDVNNRDMLRRMGHRRAGMTRREWLQKTGLAAAGVGAAAMGLGGVARAHGDPVQEHANHIKAGILRKDDPYHPETWWVECTETPAQSGDSVMCVYPTEDPDQDQEHIQWAFDNIADNGDGAVVLLKAVDLGGNHKEFIFPTVTSLVFPWNSGPTLGFRGFPVTGADFWFPASPEQLPPDFPEPPRLYKVGKLNNGDTITVTGEVVNGNKTTIKNGYNAINVGWRGWGPEFDIQDDPNTPWDDSTPPPNSFNFAKLNVTIKNIKFDPANWTAIHVVRANDITIEYCDIFGGSPFDDPFGPGHPLSWAIVTGMVTGPPGSYDPNTVTGKVTIRNNYINGRYDVKQPPCDGGYVQMGFDGNCYYGIFGGFMIGVSHPTEVSVSDNKIFNCDYGLVTIQVDAPCFIQRNEVITAKKGLALTGMFLYDLKDSLVEDNLITAYAFGSDWLGSYDIAGQGIDIGLQFFSYDENHNNEVLNNTIILNKSPYGNDITPFAGIYVESNDNRFIANRISGVCRSAFYIGHEVFGSGWLNESSGNFFLGNNLTGIDLSDEDTLLYFFGAATENNTVKGYTGGSNKKVIDLTDGKNNISGVK